MQQKVEDLEHKIKQRDAIIEEFQKKEEDMQKKFELDTEKIRESSFEKDN